GPGVSEDERRRAPGQDRGRARSLIPPVDRWPRRRRLAVRPGRVQVRGAPGDRRNRRRRPRPLARADRWGRRPTVRERLPGPDRPGGGRSPPDRGAVRTAMASTPEQRDLERLRYWQGQMLRSRDFRDQAAQQAELRWWHNRALHNAYGVVAGLGVTL